jgi:TP901 family phage tail tape measure protein
MTVRELFIKLGFKTDHTKAKRFNRTTNKMKFNMQGLKDKFGGILGQIPGLGRLSGIFSSANMKLAAIAVTIGAVVAGINKMRKGFEKFERGLKGAARVLEANVKQQQLLKESALEAGGASVFSTAKAAEAQKFLAMAGLNLQQVIKALPKTLQLAAAAEMDLARAADISTNIMASNKIEVEELGRVNDVLAKTANSANTNVAGLGEAFSTLGATGNLAGLSIEELSAAFGTLANNGIKGSLAGTLLRNAITDLRSPTDKIQAAFEKANINLSDFIDQSGKFKDFSGLLKQIENLDEASRKLFFESFGKASRGKRALEIFTNAQVNSLETLIQKNEDASGTAQKAAAFAFKGLSGASDEFTSRMEAASNKAFEESGLAMIFEQMIRFFSDILPPLIKHVGAALGPFIKPIGVALKLLRPIGAIFRILIALGKTLVKTVFAPWNFLFKGIGDGIDTANDKLFNFVEKAEELLSFKNVKRIFLGVIDFIIEKINFLIKQLNKIPKVSIRELKKFNPAQEIMNNTKKTNVNINQNNNFSGVNNSDDISNAVGEKTKAIFNLELKKVLIEAGF